MSARFFGLLVRGVFLFAFAAFLCASIRHVATFFHNFEPTDTDWTGSYALAIAIDGTALILTSGIMFFGEKMTLASKIFVWFFIVGLTAFSWVVNWEYALRFQSLDLTHNPTLLWLNPILASSFAFLNLAYSIVSENFNFRVKTQAELQAEITERESRIGLEKRLQELKRESAGPGLIERTKNIAIEAKKAVGEVIQNKPETGAISLAQTATVAPPSEPLVEPMIEPQTDPEISAISDENSSYDTVEIPVVTEQEHEAISSEQQAENTPETEAISASASEPKLSKMFGSNLPQIEPKNRQIRYTPADAAKLEICRKESVKTRDIQAAIRDGKLRANASGTVSKTALETWLVSRKKSEVAA